MNLGFFPKVREPMPPTHFFLIDVSHTAVTTGVTTAACASIQRVLDDIQGLHAADCFGKILTYASCSIKRSMTQAKPGCSNEGAGTEGDIMGCRTGQGPGRVCHL